MARAVQTTRRLARSITESSNLIEGFGRRERSESKAEIRAMAGAVRTSTRPDFAPGESGMGTSLCPSTSRKNRIQPSNRTFLGVASIARARRVLPRCRDAANSTLKYAIRWLNNRI